jgi:peptidoglycan/xylan/chitin deacetylase (PgdA/CDA1 family)
MLGTGSKDEGQECHPSCDDMKGIFTISLDFELHWGGFEKWLLQGADSALQSNRQPSNKHGEYVVAKDYNQYFLNTRQIIPEMLALFKKYEIHVTWATVGMLMHHSKEELMANAPALKPTYRKPDLSAYHYIETTGIGADENSDPFHFAPTLVKQILETPYQELASHTFAHFYCNEKGQHSAQFREDLKAAQRVASGYGRKLRSLVFPRNQFNDQYLKICLEEGITAVRSNPLDWFWHIESTQDESLWKRLNRGADAYLPIGKRNTYALKQLPARDGFPLCIPASRLLRPYHPKELFLNSMKIARIKSEMARAAKNKEVYHLWWHPHNFGKYPQESLHALNSILNYYATCRNQWDMHSLSMSELSHLQRE